MTTYSIISTRARLSEAEYEAAKVAAIRDNASLADWIGEAVRQRLTRSRQSS
jgi:predicted HicB family RNase H-like nuclease